MVINTHAQLKAAILDLKEKEQKQKELLIEQFHRTKESFHPGNILKNTFIAITASVPEGNNNILKTVLGIGAGLITKRLFVRGSGSVIKKILGTVIEMGVAKTVASHSDNISDKIKLAGVQLLKKFFKPKTVEKFGSHS